MLLSEIFNMPFLIYLGIFLILIGLIGLYFNQKINEQNHKISSMFDLVSTMAEEMNYMRNRIQPVQYNVPVHLQKEIQKNTQNEDLQLLRNNLIQVSDNEDESSDDEISEYDDDSSSDDESVDDENNDIELNEEIKIINIDDGESIFNLQNEITSLSKEEINDSNTSSDNELEDDNELEHDNEFCDFDEDDDELNENKNQHNENNDDDDDEKLKKSINNSLFKKINIDISAINDENIDYKKFPLNKLRQIVSEKKLSTDPSKLKKNELLKLLNVE